MRAVTELRGSEADTTGIRLGAEVDEGELVDGHADLVALAVREPQHASGGHRLLDRCLDGLGVGIIRQLDFDLARVVGDTDADVHSCSSCGRSRHATRSAVGSYRGGVGTGGGDDARMREVDELEAIRRRVINVVGHALRTPVTTIAGIANALGATRDEATRTVLIDGLNRNARRLEGLVDDLLLAADVTTALPAGDPVSIAVRPELDAIWRSLEEDGELTVDGDELYVLVRADSFQRIVRALLDNASRYGHGPIAVTCATAPSRVRIEVISAGDVPTDEEVDRAFEVFYRGEHAVMAAPGLGLGLPVARRLARAEGGDVWLQRRDNAIVATLELPT